MKKIKIHLLIIFVCLGLNCFAQENYLFRPTPEKSNVQLKQFSAITRQQTVELNNRLFKNGAKLKAILFDKEVSISLLTSEVTGSAVVWKGSIASENKTDYFIAIENKKTYAVNFTYNNKSFQLRQLEGNLYQLREINQQKFEEEGEPIIPKLDKPTALKDCPNTDGPAFIDVMVIYTQAAETGAGSKANMEAEIYLAVAETNMAYSFSGVTQRLRLVHTSKTSHPETGGDFSADLAWVTNDAGIAALRNTHSADCVVLITEPGSYCGLGYYMSPASAGFDANAFCVVKRSCATGYFSFGHELGHNMGAIHDCAASPSSGINHGFSYCGTNPYRTIMAYNQCSNPRVMRFSNPNLTFNGVAMGTNTGTCQANVAATLNSNASIVANFRCSSASTANVFMKDTWNDNGVEPNPNAAGEPMWTSPYIWIRNTQDNAFLHQHQHENPIMGQPNWVYVKLHNGAATSQSGNLELWYANASLSLLWPSAWTMLASIPTTISASSTTTAEHQWASLPGAGHYCMVARWVSATDPMAALETTDINANTLKNNNIIWRNLNIVMPDVNPDVSMNFIVNKGDRIEIVFPVNIETNKKFTEEKAQVLVGFESNNNKQITYEGLTALREKNYFSCKGNAVIKFGAVSKYEGKLKLRFKVPEKNIGNDYMVHVIQKSADGKIIGGVSYQIKTHKN